VVHVEIKAEELFAIGPLIVTNSMVGVLLASVVLLLAAWWFTRRSGVVPTRGQSLIELPIEFLAGVVRGTGGKRWRQFAPLIFAIFLYVLVANWLSLLPGVGTIGLAEGEPGHQIIVPFVRAGAADLNFTLGLALISFVAFIAFGLRANGLRGYLKELLIAEPAYMTPLLTPIHLISELSRVISLSMRLFGNVFAGEVLLGTMLALTTASIITIVALAWWVPGVFLGLELLFGLVQALVFALLSMTYITLAIAEHRQHGSSDDHSGGAPGQGAEPAHGSA
jgi:F-type H+-transporting ATPase subunit a